jgi:Leucine-rich repeat (LRR) protein
MVDYNNITVLKISGERLTELPDDIDKYTNLKELDCSNNQITSLNNLPPSLEILYCNHNQLVELPPLVSEGKPPNLQMLDCDDNQLTSLPPLPSTLEYLNCDNNPIQYPPADVLKESTKYIREWMSENPLTFVKSANKV